MTNEEPLDLTKMKTCAPLLGEPAATELIKVIAELEAARKEIGDLTRTICEEVQASVAMTERIAELEAAVKDYQEGKFL